MRWYEIVNEREFILYRTYRRDDNLLPRRVEQLFAGIIDEVNPSLFKEVEETDSWNTYRDISQSIQKDLDTDNIKGALNSLEQLTPLYCCLITLYRISLFWFL